MKKIMPLGLFFLFICSFQLKQFKKEKLLGSWIFETFQYPDYISPNSKQAQDANHANKGLQVTFAADNKIIFRQRNGSPQNNRTLSYELLKDNNHLALRRYR